MLLHNKVNKEHLHYKYREVTNMVKNKMFEGLKFCGEVEESDPDKCIYLNEIVEVLYSKQK